MIEIKDMPKLESPFEREEVDGKYICTPKIKKEHKWIFTKDCTATEKLEGTNVSIAIQDGIIIGIWNRTERLPFFNKGKKFIIEGLLDSYEKGYMEFLPDGQHFGELIGKKVQGNPYRIERHLWVPFTRLRKQYEYKFWNSITEEVQGKSDEEIFTIVSEVFEGLISLYKLKTIGTIGTNKSLKQLIEEKAVHKDTKFEGLAAEGIVFYNNKTGEMCKLRRDMFEWFQGREHKKRYKINGKIEEAKK